MHLKSVIALGVAVILWEGISAEENNSNSRSHRIRRFANEGCDELIPAFIDKILKNEMSIESEPCDESGKFPKPGDCTVFFKCVHARGRIMPFVEYCAIGYTFVNESCMPSSNATDCPQYNCELLEEPKSPEAQADDSNGHDVDEEKSSTASSQQDSEEKSSTASSQQDSEEKSSTASSQQDSEEKSSTASSQQDSEEKSSTASSQQDSVLNTNEGKNKEPSKDVEMKFAAQQASPTDNGGGCNLSFSASFMFIVGVVSSKVIYETCL